MEWFKSILGFSSEEELSKSPPDKGFVITLPSTQGRDELFEIQKDVDNHQLIEALEQSWKESKEDTLKIIFFLRDCRKGRGSRDLFRKCVEWIIDNEEDAIKYNLYKFPDHGYWKDVWILLGTTLEKDAIRFYASALSRDIKLLNDGHTIDISLAGKWAPSEGSSLDKKFDIVSKLCKQLQITKSQYRKEILIPLRKALEISNSKRGQSFWPAPQIYKYYTEL